MARFCPPAGGLFFVRELSASIQDAAWFFFKRFAALSGKF
jgi:hypothetical protein